MAATVVYGEQTQTSRFVSVTNQFLPAVTAISKTIARKVRAGATNFANAVSAPPASATAVFIKADTATQGNWKTNYGTAGYAIAGDRTDLPVYSDITFSGLAPYVWSNSTVDQRALRKSSLADRIAATWFASTPFNINVSFNDALTHQVALYCLDWDRGGRAETIDVLDAATGALLDSQKLSAFSDGQYIVWNVTGNVSFRVWKQIGYNGVISAVFIDPAAGTPIPTPSATPISTPSATPTATPSPAPGNPGIAQFVRSDTATKGNWKGVYGLEGYSLASDGTSNPAYASVSFSGKNDYIWALPTNDPRGLQAVANAGRIAATWFASTPFDVDVNIIDGSSHQVSLYCMDWDSGGRVQNVDAIDASTGTVLNSQNLTSFTGGRYLSWTISGHVIFRARRAVGYNAVISGLFFDSVGTTPPSPTPTPTPNPSPSPTPLASPTPSPMPSATPSPSPSPTTSPSPVPTPSPSPSATPLPSPSATPPTGAAHFVSTDGAGTSCALRTPCSLDYALSSAANAVINPGDTVYLRGGLYQRTSATPNDSSTMFSVTVAGTPQAPITFRPYPGESATIDGSSIAAIHIFYITGGGYLTFRDLEVMNSAYKLPPYAAACNPADPYNPSHIGPRTNCETGGGYYGRGTAFNVSAPGIKIINNVIHDTGMGVFSGPASSDMEVTGNLIYFNGWNGPDRGHGHGIYGQNQTGQKIFRDNIIFGNYGYGIQAYGTSNSYLRNFVIDGNVIFGNGALANNGWQPGLLLGGGAPVINSQVTGNHVYRPLSNSRGHNVEIGYPLLVSIMNQDVTVTGNQFIGGGPTLDVTSWQQATISNNRVIGNSELFWLNQSLAAVAYRPVNQVDNNSYIFQRLPTSIQPFRILVDGAAKFGGGLDGWQSQTGFDLHSSYSEALPSDQEVFIRQNAYEAGRANIIVYNWPKKSTVSVNVSSILSPGDVYEVRNAQNYLAGPISSGVYLGGSLELPTVGLSVATPVGLGSAPQLTGDDFSVLVLRKIR